MSQNQSQNPSPKVRIKKFAQKQVVVTNKSQIRLVVSNYMPDSDGHGRKLLIDGMNQVKERLKLKDQYDKVDMGAFGDYKPIVPKNAVTHWVDRMINNTFGAIREDLLVVWNLQDGKHTFDPYTGEIKYDVN